VVAATGDDEDNLVVSLLVKRWYAMPRVVARVNNPKNTWMFTDEWGVDTAVSAPAVMTWLLERAVGVQDVVALLRAERGRGVALVELTLDEDAPVLGRRPDEVDLPAGSSWSPWSGATRSWPARRSARSSPPTRSWPSPPSRPSPTCAASSAASSAAPTSPPADRPACGTLPPRSGM
jgi:TrkA-N domain